MHKTLGAWSVVRGFGNVSYFSISYFVLFFVPLAVDLWKEVPWGLASENWVPAFPITLKFLYVASFFYSIAIAIYQYRCPREIKRFGNVDEYVKSQHPIFSQSNANHSVEIVLAHLDTVTDKEAISQILELLQHVDISKDFEREKAKQALNELVAKFRDDAVQRYLVKSYLDKDSSRPVLRCASLLMYICGTLILIGLLLWRTYSVMVA